MGGEIETSLAEVDRKALEDLVVGNGDLERLEARASGLRPSDPEQWHLDWLSQALAAPSGPRVGARVSSPPSWAEVAKKIEGALF